MRIVSPFVIFLVSALTLFPGFGGEFLLLDDNEYFTENPYILAGLSLDGIEWAFTHTFSGHWHPLTWISLMIDASLFGSSSDYSRLANVTLHSLACAILFYPVLRMTGGRALVTTSALVLFAINPLRLESVLWVSERKDVLSFFFLSLTLFSYHYYLESRKLGHLLAAVCFSSLGLLSKPSLVPLPVLLVLMDYLDSSELSIRKVTAWIYSKWPFWILSVATSIAAIVGQRASGGLQSVSSLSLSERFTNCVIGYLAYLGKLVYPFDLALFYPLQTYPESTAVGGLIALACISFYLIHAAAVTPSRSTKLLAVSWLWFMISLVPVIGLIQIGWQQFADRWTYIPHLLPTVALCYCIPNALKKSRYIVPIIGLAAGLILFRETRALAPLWLSSERLFQHTLSLTSQNFLIHTNYGVALERKGDMSGAMHHYREALRFHPDYPLALNNVGVLLANEGKFAESIVYFKRALVRTPANATARYHLGLALHRMGAIDAALKEWLTVLELNPSDAPSTAMLRSTLEQLSVEDCERGKIAETLQHFRNVVINQLEQSQVELLQSKSCLTK